MNKPPTKTPRLILSTLCLALAAAIAASCSKKEEGAEKNEGGEKKHEENVVTLAKEGLEHVEIKAEPVTFGKLETTLRAAGKLSENMNKTAKVVTTLEGRLMKLNYDVNDSVKAGDVLALVQTPELLGKLLEVKAPIDGIVTERKSTAGELVTKETEIYTISDPADLWLLAEIKEANIGQVKVGQDAKFTVLAYPNEPFHGKVVRIGNRVEDQSRTLEVRIEVNNADGRLKPGMFADVEIVTTVQENVLVIPDTALQTDGENQIVFVALDDTKFEKRVVTTGREQHGRLEVTEGIKEGEKVVVTGSFILKSEMLKGELGEE